MLAPSDFLESAAATLTLQEAILPDQVRSTDDLAVAMSLSVWKTLTPGGQPSDTTTHIQKARDTSVARKLYSDLPISCDTPVDKPGSELLRLHTSEISSTLLQLQRSLYVCHMERSAWQ